MARPRTWDDERLRDAVSAAATWNDVVKGVGRKPSARATRSVQGHALRIGLPVDHLPAMLEDAEAFGLDWTTRKKDLAQAVADAQSWAEVMRRLGCENSGSALAAAKTRAIELGLDTSHLPPVWNRRELAPDRPVPFAAEPSARNIRAAAIGEAVAWFLRRGYIPSIPVEAARYDLVVESDDGLKKIQVKSTTSQDRSGLWVAGISRMQYGVRDSLNTNGNRGPRPYDPDEVDLFFILVGNGSRYLIPIEATKGQVSLTLDRKYAAYKVE